MSSCLKITKEETTKTCIPDFNDYYGDLVFDFTKKDKKNKGKVSTIADSRKLSKALSSSNSRFSQCSQKHSLKPSYIKEIKQLYRPKEKSTSKHKHLVERKKNKSKSLSHKH